ncbi:MAG: hypothetical protein JWM12_2552 [Ilumatobacteraceae bacterium]|nr:hypothetical protein [Ilumatobacteraceae bacterium]
MTLRAITATEPVIVAAELAAGHDGLAEVLVGIRYPNGAERAVSLPYEAVDEAVEAAGVASLTELIGRPWSVLAHPAAHPAAHPTAHPVGRTRPENAHPNEPGAH